MKKILFFVLVILGVVGIGYVASIYFNTTEIDEVSPLESKNGIKDNLDSMSEADKKEFMKQVDEMKDVVMVKDQAMSEIGSNPRLVAKGEFKPRFHSVEGSAQLIEIGDEKIVRFEDFETDNGPNLHIYLATDLGADDFVDLGPIRATKGNINYEVDASVDTSRYNKVLVWCVPFGVLFSYADLAQ